MLAHPRILNLASLTVAAIALIFAGILPSRGFGAEVVPAKDRGASTAPARGTFEPQADPHKAPAKPAAKGHEPQPGLSGAPHWAYLGENGPKEWGVISPEFALCGTGQNQSPIDVQRVYSGAEPRIQFNYRPSKLRIVNNGHTIQINTDPGSFIKIDERTFDLVQFHFHTPSEHTVKGQAYDMEVHFVHKSAEGVLAVVGVLMKRGAVNEGLQDVWEHLPSLPGEERSYQTVTVNPAELLPPSQAYYLYSGSLTTPPCSEGVRWNLMLTPIEISDAQAGAFKRLFPLNARPVQPLRERFVINVTGAK